MKPVLPIAAATRAKPNGHFGTHLGGIYARKTFSDLRIHYDAHRHDLDGSAENFSSFSSMNHSLHEEIASHFEEIEDRICAIGARVPPIDFPPSTFSLALVTQHT